MSSLIAIIIAVAKGSRAVDSILGQLVTAYAAWKTSQNLTDEQLKNAAVRAAIAAARGQLLPLCPTCPFADHGTEQRPTAAGPP